MLFTSSMDDKINIQDRSGNTALHRRIFNENTFLVQIRSGDEYSKWQNLKLYLNRRTEYENRISPVMKQELHRFAWPTFLYDYNFQRRTKQHNISKIIFVWVHSFSRWISSFCIELVEWARQKAQWQDEALTQAHRTIAQWGMKVFLIHMRLFLKDL